MLRQIVQDPASYQVALLKLQEKLRIGTLDFLKDEEKAVIRGLAIEQQRYCRRLAATVQSGEYQFSPMNFLQIQQKDKLRSLYHPSTLDDLLVDRVLAKTLSESVVPLKNLNRFSKLFTLSAYLRSKPEAKGFYVLRADIKSYYESILTDESSSLWTRLRGVLGSSDLLELLTQIIRPTYLTPEGEIARLERGLPTGCVTTSVLSQFYLSEVDATFAQQGSSIFYARYIDDILFVSQDLNSTQAAHELLQSSFGSLGLTLHQTKTRLIYLNKAARAAECEGREMVTFLGANVHADGTLSLPPPKARLLMDGLLERLFATAELLEREKVGVEAKGKVLCQVVKQAFTKNSLLSLREAKELFSVMSNQGQINQLDYRIALEIAQILSGVKGVRSFRHYPPKRLRAEFGLPSLRELSKT